MTTENQAPEGADRLAHALEDLLMYTAENDPGQGDPDRDHTSVTAAMSALASYRAALAAQPQAAPGMAMVPVETLTAWKAMVNTLAVLSLKSERTTAGITLKRLIQDEIDAAPQTKEPTNDR